MPQMFVNSTSFEIGANSNIDFDLFDSAAIFGLNTTTYCKVGQALFIYTFCHYISFALFQDRDRDKQCFRSYGSHVIVIVLK